MWPYIVLGGLQGFFEWLPVSSEGIVALASQILFKDVNNLEIALFLHLGTLLAAVIYFWNEWKQILALKDIRIIRFLLVSTAISLIIGYPLYRVVKRGMLLGNTFLLIMGLGLLITSFFHQKKANFQISSDIALAVLTGFLQGLAVIPGLSRSGATIFGLSLGKINPDKILKISYMMSVPVVLASSLYLFLGNQELVWQGWPALVSSAVVGLCSLHFLLQIAKKMNFFKFTFVFGALCILGAVVGFII